MDKGSIGEGLVFHAGFPNAGEDGLGSLSIDGLVVKRPASTFLWRLEAPGIPELHWRTGDIVVVDRSLQPRNQDLVVAVVDSDFVVRRLNGQSLFRPDGQPESAEGVVLWGVVTHVIQAFRQ